MTLVPSSLSLCPEPCQAVKAKTAPKAAATTKQAVQLIDSKRAYNISILMNGEGIEM